MDAKKVKLLQFPLHNFEGLSMTWSCVQVQRVSFEHICQSCWRGFGEQMSSRLGASRPPFERWQKNTWLGGSRGVRGSDRVWAGLRHSSVYVWHDVHGKPKVMMENPLHGRTRLPASGKTRPGSRGCFVSPESVSCVHERASVVKKVKISEHLKTHFFAFLTCFCEQVYSVSFGAETDPGKIF